MTYDDKENMFRESRKWLGAIGLQIITYLEYSQRGADLDIIAETTNRFQELPRGGGSPGKPTTSLTTTSFNTMMKTSSRR